MTNLSIIVGRFQAHYLHSGYIFLIRESLKTCDKFALAISESPIPESRRNPFTIEERRAIILKELTSFNLLDKFIGFVFVKDQPDDKEWSRNLDSAIKRTLLTYCINSPKYDGNGVIVTLFGSRDSFIPYYSGENKVVEVDSPVKELSSTEVRNDLLSRIDESYYTDPRYLAGKLKAIHAQYPKVFPTVDIAIINDNDEVLLGRKPNEKFWRFPGGFADPTDLSFELAAKREAIEECGDIEIDEIRYVASVRINDWRYRSEVDKIITSFFVAKFIYGCPKPSDDLQDLEWFSITDLKIWQATETIMQGHKPLFEKLVQYLENQK